ncbi:MAG: Spermidine/putrescine import ATP-binding protein PotA [Phycisphaerae bacterium]|nr:Spermidine/putrescine import ATP-binding protein PotA [Phycisphaerae bacterium]
MDISAWPANRRSVNTVFQSYALFPHLNVFENVAFGLRARRFASGQVDRRVGDAMAMLQLDGLTDRHADQLSGGQKQRVALARALVNEPDVLLLDEPMSALDAKLRGEVQLELRRLQRRIGKTFVLVTHDQDEAMTVSDRILVMNDGRIEQAGRPREVYEHPVSRFVATFLGAANLIPATGREGQAVRTELGLFTPRVTPQWARGTLAIRPERVELCPAQPDANGLAVTAADVIYRGDHVDIFAQPGNLRVRASSACGVQPGQSLWLRLPPEHLEALRE